MAVTDARRWLHVLRAMPDFRCDATPSEPGAELELDEEILGAYDNGPHGRIYITTLGLRWVSEPAALPVAVRYDDIERVSAPEEKQTDSPCIDIAMRDGGRLQLPVCGRRGRFLDVYELARYLARVSGA